MSPTTATTALIDNLTIVAMDLERVVAEQSVRARNGRIAAVGRRGLLRALACAYLLPGLADMHVHLLCKENRRPTRPSQPRRGPPRRRRSGSAANVGLHVEA